MQFWLAHPLFVGMCSAAAAVAVVLLEAIVADLFPRFFNRHWGEFDPCVKLIFWILIIVVAISVARIVLEEVSLWDLLR